MQPTHVTTSTNAAKTIGQLLSELRKQRRLTGEQLARKAGTSQSRISKIENGYSDSLEPAQIENIANILKAPKAIRQQISLLLLRHGAGSEAHFTYPFEFPKYVADLDARTTVFRTFLVWGFSSLMQTAAYREALVRKLGLSEADIRTELSQNITRQDAMWTSGKMHYFVMPEAVLYTTPADADVQVVQLDRLERMIGLKHIKIGIIPMQMGASVLETGTFTVHDDHMLEVHLADRILRFDDLGTVLKFLQAFTELEEKAVYDTEAIGLIRKAASYFERL